MDEAKVGDWVRTAIGFEPILGWFHASKDSQGVEFLKISTDSGEVRNLSKTYFMWIYSYPNYLSQYDVFVQIANHHKVLTLTPSHVLYLANGLLVTAESLNLGDSILTSTFHMIISILS